MMVDIPYDFKELLGANPISDALNAGAAIRTAVPAL
jgi:hypothetical protein